MENKVVLLAPLPPPHGGIAEWTTKMLKTKYSNNWQIDIVDEKIEYKRGVYSVKKNYIKELKRCIKIWKSVWKKAREKNTKLFHSCIPATTTAILREIINMYIAHIHHKKFIVHFRCTVSNMVKSQINYKILKFFCKRCDYVIVLNKESEMFVYRFCKKVEIIPNFIEYDNIFLPKVKKNVKKAVYCGGVMKAKGCDKILKLSKEYKNIEFYLIGNIKEDIEKIYNKKNYPNVFLTGELNHDDVLKILKKSDLFLFLSRYNGEGFSNALLEAMSLGLPCLVSDWAANKDMIENKGGIVTGETIKQIKRDFDMMLSAEKRKKMSAWNIDKVRNFYSEENIVSKYIRIYDFLMEV